LIASVPEVPQNQTMPGVSAIPANNRPSKASAHFLFEGKDVTESGRNCESGFDVFWVATGLRPAQYHLWLVSTTPWRWLWARATASSVLALTCIGRV
jgi:hypothetical protein